MMKKSLLALAVAGLSVNAFAINLNDGTEPSFFASEIAVPSTGVSVTAPLTAKVKAGFALPTSYVRFELGNGATFGGTGLTSAALAAAGGAGIAAAPAANQISLASGGGATDNYAIFAITAPIAADTVFTLTTSPKVVSQNAVPVSYSLYETAANAVNKANTLNSKTGNLLSFAPALSITAVGKVDNYIDIIGNKGLTFIDKKTSAVKSTSSSLVELSVALVDGKTTGGSVPSLLTGTPVAAVSDILSGYSWNLKGNFSAVATDGLKDANGTAFKVATDKQSATLNVTDTTKDAGIVTYTITGTDAIAETNIGAIFNPTAKDATFKVDSLSFNNVDNVAKNGTTKALNLALKPGGAFSNFVRINNTDSIPGLFFIKVINDAGDSATFPLSAVAGQPDTIAARASTSQMPIADIFAAAEAEGLALTGEGKLRLEITGQTNSLDAQVYTVSTDGTTFSKF